MKKEKVFTNHIFDKLIFKIYKEILQLNSKTKQHPSLMRKGHKQTFLKRRQANGQQYNKRLSTLLIIREMQIRTIVRYHLTPVRISSIQSLSCVRLFATPWTSACQASLSITNSRSLLKLMSIKSVMPSNHLTLCHPLLFLHSIFSSIRVFSNELTPHIRWPKYWSFSFSISPSNEYSGLISFRVN